MKDLFESEHIKLLTKANEKLPEIFSLEGVALPDSSVIEQASGHLAAAFTASLVKEGQSVADLTAGLGVNTYYFSLRASQVFAVEKNKTRYDCLVHNLKLGHRINVNCYNMECEEWLRVSNFGFDIAYLDPSRRDFSQRYFLMKDYVPNIDLIINELLKRNKAESLSGCNKLFIKLSPLLDISSIFKDLPSVKGIYILEVKREVKELLVELELNELGNSFSPFIIPVILTDDKPPIFRAIKFNIKDNYPLQFVDSPSNVVSGGFIYEPSPSLMKSGLFNELGNHYQLIKFSKDTHLFYSNILDLTFPGRIFKVKDIVGSKELKKLKGARYSVISRNHPAKANELENRFHLKPDETNFLIACSIRKHKAIFSTEKVL